MVSDDLRRLAEILLDLAAYQQIELLIGAAHLDIALERHRIVSLRQRIEQFVNRDGRAFFVAFGEIVALQNARHRVSRTQADQVFEAQRLQPFTVVTDFGFYRIENLEQLRLVRLGVAVDLLARHRRARDVAAAGVADHGGGVADDEDHGVAQILEMLHLPQDHGVAQVQVGRSGIEARL